MEATIGNPVTRRDRWGWYLYDFGNSAYAAVVLLAIYSAYFKDGVVGGESGTRLWGISISIAMIVVALTAPVLGVIADYSASKKKFLGIYTATACVFTALLFFVQQGDIFTGMLFFILAEIGYRSSQVFYNALLPEIATPDEIGTVSGNGWAIGSLGGIVCLLIVLPLIVVNSGNTFFVRLAMPITALFFALSALPIFLWLRERGEKKEMPANTTYLTLGFRQLWATLKKARQYKEFLKFMLAFLVFNDGIIMALDFAAIIGLVLFGLTQQDLIIFIIVVQIFSVIGAYVFGIITDRWDGKKALLASILLMIGAVIWLFVDRTGSQVIFYIIGALAGFALTGVQSVSRTMITILTPPKQSAEFFGLFAFVGRTSSFIGPAVYGFVAAGVAQRLIASGEVAELAEQAGQRSAILAIIGFLVVGLVLLLFVNQQKGYREARGI
jgi:UMF1 family MFS transporter